MPHSRAVELVQMARLLGRPEIADWDVGTPEGRSELERAVDSGFERLTQGLLEEAAASDDVLDAASAGTFVDDRLAFLSDLLTEDQRRRLREACRKATADWG